MRFLSLLMPNMTNFYIIIQMKSVSYQIIGRVDLANSSFNITKNFSQF